MSAVVGAGQRLLVLTCTLQSHVQAGKSGIGAGTLPGHMVCEDILRGRHKITHCIGNRKLSSGQCLAGGMSFDIPRKEGGAKDTSVEHKLTISCSSDPPSDRAPISVRMAVLLIALRAVRNRTLRLVWLSGFKTKSMRARFIESSRR